jgi:hypothetical protein
MPRVRQTNHQDAEPSINTSDGLCGDSAIDTVLPDQRRPIGNPTDMERTIQENRDAWGDE